MECFTICKSSFKGRYYDVVRQKLLQQHRQAESSEVSDDVPVTAQYPFVEQITNAIRRIATGNYQNINYYLP